MSPAWHLKPKTVATLIERIEVEYLAHGGTENGNLIVTFDQFVAAGVSRKDIYRALDLAQSLGLIEVIRSEQLLAGVRPPNAYRLTYVPSHDQRSPTDEWSFRGQDTVRALIEAYQSECRKGRKPAS